MYYNSAQSGQYCIFFCRRHVLSVTNLSLRKNIQIEQNLKKKNGGKSNTLRSRMFPNSIAVGVSCEKKKEDTYSHEMFSFHSINFTSLVQIFETFPYLL